MIQVPETKRNSRYGCDTHESDRAGMREEEGSRYTSYGRISYFNNTNSQLLGKRMRELGVQEDII